MCSEKLVTVIHQTLSCVPGPPMFMIKWSNKAERLGPGYWNSGESKRVAALAIWPQNKLNMGWRQNKDGLCSGYVELS